MPICQRIKHIAYAESRFLMVGPVLCGVAPGLRPQFVNHPSALFLGQKGGRLGEIVNRKGGDKGHSNCQKSFQDENPAPAGIPAHPVHFLFPVSFVLEGDPETYTNRVREESRESTGDAGRAEEESLSVLGFLTGIPHGDVVGGAGVQTSLCGKSG